MAHAQITGNVLDHARLAEMFKFFETKVFKSLFKNVLCKVMQGCYKVYYYICLIFQLLLSLIIIINYRIYRTQYTQLQS